MKKEKIIGILGGLGPYATIDVFKRIVDLTPAKKDWEHLRIIIDNNPKIPSRSRAILYGEESPVPEMVKTAKNLEKAGVDFIIIPCNTAHHFYKEVQENVNVPVINMIEGVTEHVIKKMQGIKKIGLLATTVTAKGKLYKESFEKYGIKVLTPNEEDQKIIYNVIEDIKLSTINFNTKKNIISVSKKMISEGAEAILAGCTEIPIVLKQEDLNVAFFDSNQILAEMAVKKARGE